MRDIQQQQVRRALLSAGLRGRGVLGALSMRSKRQPQLSASVAALMKSTHSQQLQLNRANRIMCMDCYLAELDEA